MRIISLLNISAILIAVALPKPAGAASATEPSEILAGVCRGLFQAAAERFHPNPPHSPFQIVTVSIWTVRTEYRGHSLGRGPEKEFEVGRFETINPFSHDPFVSVELTRSKEFQGFHDIHIRGPRNQVLRHLLELNQRKASALDRDEISLLAERGAIFSDVESFLFKFPIDQPGNEIPELSTILTAIQKKREQIRYELQFSKLIDRVDVTIEIPVKLLKKPQGFVRSFLSRFRRDDHPEITTPASFSDSIAKRYPRALFVAADGPKVAVRLYGRRNWILSDIYRIIRDGQNMDMIDSPVAALTSAYEALDQKYPPFTDAAAKQAEILRRAKTEGRLISFY